MVLASWTPLIDSPSSMVTLRSANSRCCWVAQHRDMTDRPDPAGDETLSDAFWTVARQLRETSHEALAPWDLTPSHLRALRVLRRHGMPPRHLARSLTRQVAAPRPG
jgi:hypothetical protein